MKVVKFIFVTVIILVITSFIPFKLFDKVKDDHYYSQADGTFIKGPMGYMQIISQNENITDELKNDVFNLSSEYSNIIQHKQKAFINLFFYVSIILGVMLIVLGIILLKVTKHSLLGKCLITAGVISILIYIYMYTSTLNSLTPIYNM